MVTSTVLPAEPETSAVCAASGSRISWPRPSIAKPAAMVSRRSQALNVTPEPVGDAPGVERSVVGPAPGDVVGLLVVEVGGSEELPLEVVEPLYRIRHVLPLRPGR